MLPPLPRCSGWAYSTLISPSHVSLPRKGHRVGLHIVLFEACSAFTRVAACTLARSPYFVTRYPKASDISSPPCLLRLLPAGAVAGWDLHPLESAAFSRRTPNAGIPTLELALETRHSTRRTISPIRNQVTEIPTSDSRPSLPLKRLAVPLQSRRLSGRRRGSGSLIDALLVGNERALRSGASRQAREEGEPSAGLAAVG